MISSYIKPIRYDRMSLASDIKIMDKKTADEIRGLTFDKLENKLRLAGLSKQEMSAAYERLEMIQSALEIGNIKIINNDKEWEKLSRSRRSKRQIQTSAESVAFKNKNLPANSPYRYANNIFGLASIMEKQYSNPRKIANKDISGIKGDIPTGTAVNIVDNHAMQAAC